MQQREQQHPEQARPLASRARTLTVGNPSKMGSWDERKNLNKERKQRSSEGWEESRPLGAASPPIFLFCEGSAIKTVWRWSALYCRGAPVDVDRRLLSRRRDVPLWPLYVFLAQYSLSIFFFRILSVFFPKQNTAPQTGPIFSNILYIPAENR